MTTHHVQCSSLCSATLIRRKTAERTKKLWADDKWEDVVGNDDGSGGAGGSGGGVGGGSEIRPKKSMRTQEGQPGVAVDNVEDEDEVPSDGGDDRVAKEGDKKEKGGKR